MRQRIHESAQYWKNIALCLERELELLDAERAERKARQVLSEAEIRALKLVAHGMTSQQIASRLVLSERTVQGHMWSLRSKINAKNSTQAALWAWRNGLVSIDDAWQTVVKQQGLEA